jgi:hypothetical protein
LEFQPVYALAYVAHIDFPPVFLSLMELYQWRGTFPILVLPKYGVTITVMM